MLLIHGRILPLPEIEYKISDIDQHTTIEGVKIGTWWLNKCFSKVSDPHDQVIPSKTDTFMFFGIKSMTILVGSEEGLVTYISALTDFTNATNSIRLLKPSVWQQQFYFPIFKNIDIPVRELLEEFYEKNSRLPNKLVFFQAAGDNEFCKTILDHELKSIQTTCESKYDCLTIKTNKINVVVFL